jgi:ribosomal protein S18 acetylase RimI-like enzyme
MEFTIKKLSPTLIEDFFYFFDNRAFCDNPEWAGCYCMFYLCKSNLDAWEKRSGNMNREEAAEAIEEGRFKGYLAYHNDKPVGFCNVNEKKNLFFDKYRTESNNTGSKGIVSVVCFVIDPNFRRKGMSSHFIETIIKDYKNSEFNIIESYPSIYCTETKDNYHGYKEMYEKYDFEVVNEFEKFCIMQLNLK